MKGRGGCRESPTFGRGRGGGISHKRGCPLRGEREKEKKTTSMWEGRTFRPRKKALRSGKGVAEKIS